jgi:hypothetical protein
MSKSVSVKAHTRNKPKRKKAAAGTTKKRRSGGRRKGGGLASQVNLFSK